ncbi:MAG TPA: S9 family peptidase, partial [Blastocatellia bacterium]|nr:S9 family peptidase [Blastocatellia bacterium]
MHKFSSKALAALCLVLAVVLSDAAAQSKSTRLTPSDVFNMEFVSDPQISPDGRRVIYVRQFAEIMTDKNYSNLWIINSDGTDNRALTTGNRSDTSPRWSPDGNRIIYVSDAEGTPQIYMRWMDTGQTARLTNLQYPPAGLAWSPDGKHISFTAFVADRAPHVTNLPSPPPGAKWAEPATVIDKLVYRFNGPGYLKPGYTQLFVVPSEGGTPRQISSGNFQHGGAAFRSSDAVWTPDGKHLIMSANRRADYELEPLDTEVFEFAVADGSVRALTNRRGPDNSPAISPDGKLIAYTGLDDKYQGYQVTRLYVMNRDGSGSRLISADLDRDVVAPRWAADGSGIYFVYDDQGNSKLGFYSLDGKMKKLTDNLGGGGSAYGGGGYSISKNGAFAFGYSRPDVPSDVAVGWISNATTKVITAVNADLLAARKLGAVEEIWYESSL